MIIIIFQKFNQNIDSIWYLFSDKILAFFF